MFAQRNRRIRLPYATRARSRFDGILWGNYFPNRNFGIETRGFENVNTAEDGGHIARTLLRRQPNANKNVPTFARALPEQEQTLLAPEAI